MQPHGRVGEFLIYSEYFLLFQVTVEYDGSGSAVGDSSSGVTVNLAVLRVLSLFSSRRR